MAKKIQTTIKLQLPAGKATPAPPVGTALGPHGLNIMDFCKQFNAKTAKEADGMIFPVLVTVYTDRTFTFILKTPPASVLLKRAANIAKGSAEPNRNKVGKVTKKQVDGNCEDQACRSQHHQSGVRGAHSNGYGAQHGPGSRGSLEVQALRDRRGSSNEEVRKTRGECAQEGGSAPVQARRSRRAFEEDASHQVQRNRRTGDQSGRGPEAFRPGGSRHGGIAEWTRQVRSRAGDCGRRQSCAKRRKPEPISSAATKSCRKSWKAGRTTTQ